MCIWILAAEVLVYGWLTLLFGGLAVAICYVMV